MATRRRRMAWNTRPDEHEVQQSINRVRNAVRDRIWRNFPAPFVDYRMGAEQATTTVNLREGGSREFSTTDGMHSEMFALQRMLEERRWHLTADGRVETEGGEAVAEDDFRTEQPHCRFCSLFLHLLGLPIHDEAATRGNYNQAGNLTYSLPEQVRNNPEVLGRILSGNRSRVASLTCIWNDLDPLISDSSHPWVLRIDNANGSQTFVDQTGEVAGAGGSTVVTWDQTADARAIDVQALHNPNSPRQYLWRIAFAGIFEAQP